MNKNTKKRGVVKFFILKREKEYMAICWDFNLVEYGKNQAKLEQSMSEGAKSYLESIRTKKLSDDYLNLRPDPDIANMIEHSFLGRNTSKNTKISMPTITSAFDADLSRYFLQTIQQPYQNHDWAFN